VRARLDGLDRAGPFLLGIDCPLGVPRVWAERARITSFPGLIRQLRTGAWPELLTPAAVPAEIGIGRPFYPARPGGTSQRQLLDGLGVASLAELRRRCDRPTAVRRAACPMFWTMGAQQCGKGAIAAWRELVLPDPDRLALWPFAGPLARLLTGPLPVLAETYPAESHRQPGLRLRSKRSATDRALQAPLLRAAAASLRAELAPALARDIDRGFGDRADGEDRFDALCGLLGMLRVLAGDAPADPPAGDPALLTVEGWMLGLAG